jgi:hypothetical protein
MNWAICATVKATKLLQEGQEVVDRLPTFDLSSKRWGLEVGWMNPRITEFEHVTQSLHNESDQRAK